MESKEEKIEALRKAVDNAEKIVFFGGAGVSTESGLPDFRGEQGLYRQKYGLPPESYFSLRLLKYDPEEFFKFQRNLYFQTYIPLKFIFNISGIFFNIIQINRLISNCYLKFASEN